MERRGQTLTVLARLKDDIIDTPLRLWHIAHCKINASILHKTADRMA